MFKKIAEFFKRIIAFFTRRRKKKPKYILKEDKEKLTQEDRISHIKKESKWNT